ncbi:MAG: hypothetical protein CTY16_00715 [Methylobacter sp.]|nr:MAG: hypothetical protein CTY16_00715 [Methylobacter sp.]
MPIDSFKIATSVDINNIVILVNQAYRPETAAGWTHENLLVSGSRIAAAQVLELILASDSRILLAYRQDALLACVHLKKAGSDCHIGMLAVEPSSQGAGVGKQLLAYAENYATSEWATATFVMAVLTARTELIAFYLRRGYQKTGKQMDYPLAAGVGTPRQQNLTLAILAKHTNQLLPTITTERLRLRIPNLDDAMTVANLLTPAVSQWLAAWPEPMSGQAVAEKMADAHADIAAGQAWHFLLQRLADGVVVGWVKVSRSEADAQIGDLSYWLGEAYHGLGYATERSIQLRVLSGSTQLNLKTFYPMPTSAKKLRILALSGSLRAASLNTLVLRTLANIAPEAIDVLVYPCLGHLPLFNPDLEEPLPEPVADLKNHIIAADVLIIASPEYAHGVTGVIKNALDWMVGNESFANKPVALLNVSGRAVHAYAALREIVGMMSANIIDDASLTIPLYGKQLTEAEVLANPQTVLDLQTVLAALQKAVFGP